MSNALLQNADQDAQAGTRLYAFVNPRSGGRLGERIIAALQQLPGVQVTSMADFVGLEEEACRARMRELITHQSTPVLIAGGDGTVQWVSYLLGLTLDGGDVAGADAAAAAAAAPMASAPGAGDDGGDAPEQQQQQLHNPVAILPLGTGNELARATGWGHAFSESELETMDARVKSIVTACDRGETVLLDQWNLAIQSGGEHGDDDGDGGEEQQQQQQPLHEEVRVMNLFFSAGAFARIAHRFHEMREEDDQPRSISSIKFWHGVFGFFECCSCRPALNQVLEVRVDGQPVELPSSMQSLQVFNVHSSADGTNYWSGKCDCCCKMPCSSQRDKSEFEEPKMHDGLLEVCATGGVWHLTRIRSGFSAAKRLAQGRDVQITLHERVVVQTDGEPWMQEPCSVHITFRGKLPVVTGPQEKRNI